MAEHIPLADLLTSVRPGSHGDDWTWADETRDLWDRDRPAMYALMADIAENGQAEPVTIGDDGRLWDGHHRVVALDTLAFNWVLVRHAHQVTRDQMPQAVTR